MSLELLYEELSAMNRMIKNVHYTNLSSLEGILSSKKIYGSIYEYSTNKGKSELATLRRSIDKELSNSRRGENSNRYRIKLEKLSGSAGDVKIYLFTDRILAYVRGVRKTPISEYGIETLNKYKDSVKSLYKASNKKISEEQFFNEFKKVAKEIGNYLDKTEPRGRSISFINETPEFNSIFNTFLNKYEVEIKKYHSFFAREIGTYILKLKRGYYQREGEERLQFNDTERGIPIDPRLMRIRFVGLDMLKDGENPNDIFDDPKDIIKLIKANNSVFMKDEMYYKVMKALARKEGEHELE